MSILKTKNQPTRKIDRLRQGLINPKSLTPVNLLIDSKLHKQFKIKTIDNHTTMTDVLVEAMQDYIRRN